MGRIEIYRVSPSHTKSQEYRSVFSPLNPARQGGSDFYGPHITNQLIREALHPYPEDLVIVTKVGAIRGPLRSSQNAPPRVRTCRAAQPIIASGVRKL